MVKPMIWEPLQERPKAEPIVLNFTRSKSPPQKIGPSTNLKPIPQHRSFWVRHLIEFLRTTGLHGYKYIAMEDIPIIDRVFWATAVGVCFITAVVVVFIAWQWNSENATLTVIESTHYSIWKFLYPTVTICPLNKVSKSVAEQMSKTLVLPKDVTPEEVYDTLKEVTVLLGNMKVSDDLKTKLDNLQGVLDLNNITVLEFMNKVTPRCSELIERCSWKGTTTRCDTLFRRIMTASGHCCAFNYYATKKPLYYSQKLAVITPTTPRRVAGCGYQTALSVLLRVKPEEFYSSTFGSYGVRVFIQYAYEFPDENASTNLVGSSAEAFFAIAPETTYSTPGIGSFSVAKRNCVFTNERKTSTFTKYTYTNCLAECRSDIVFTLCGCVPYFLPNNGSRRFCDFRNVKCVYEARDSYIGSIPNINSKRCDCVAECQHYSYPVELSSGKLTATNAYNSLSFFKDVHLANQSVAHVYFKDLVGTRYRKDVYMNWHNLLSTFGGLLGLFIGFSMVSGFELLYFFSLRLFFDMKQKKKKQTAVVSVVWEENMHHETNLRKPINFEEHMKKTEMKWVKPAKPRGYNIPKN